MRITLGYSLPFWTTPIFARVSVTFLNRNVLEAHPYSIIATNVPQSFDDVLNLDVQRADYKALSSSRPSPGAQCTEPSLPRSRLTADHSTA